jgi:hypothetical protein
MIPPFRITGNRPLKRRKSHNEALALEITILQRTLNRPWNENNTAKFNKKYHRRLDVSRYALLPVRSFAYSIQPHNISVDNGLNIALLINRGISDSFFEIGHGETFEKCDIFSSGKEGKKFNRKNTLSILRIRI